VLPYCEKGLIDKVFPRIKSCIDKCEDEKFIKIEAGRKIKME